jgi:hypothetical protein
VLHREGEEVKPNCYECKYRDNLPGNAHSQCRHPGAGNDGSNPLFAAFAIMAKRIGPIPHPPNATVNVVGDPHGIAHGWFAWPFNFDPVWLVSCDGFEKP